MSVPATCYYPGGSIASNHTPCDTSSGESHCCQYADFCLTNGHCLQDNQAWSNRVARGSCTDDSWASSSCPAECSDVRTDEDCTFFLAYETQLGAFCCGQAYNPDNGTCGIASRGSDQPFDLALGRVVWSRTDGSYMSNGSLTQSEILASSDNLTDYAASVSTVTATGETAAPTGLTSHSSDVTADVAGIAVPLGVLLLIALMIIALLYSRLRKAKQQLASRQAPSEGVVGASVADINQMSYHGGASQVPHKDPPGVLKPVEIDNTWRAHELGAGR